MGSPKPALPVLSGGGARTSYLLRMKVVEHYFVCY